MQLHVGIFVMTELILSNVNGCPSGGKETKKGNPFSPILQKIPNHSKLPMLLFSLSDLTTEATSLNNRVDYYSTQPPPPQLPCCTNPVSNNPGQTLYSNCNPNCPCCKVGSNTTPSFIRMVENKPGIDCITCNQTTAQPCPKPPCPTNQTTLQPCLKPPCSTLQPVQTTTRSKFGGKGKIKEIHIKTGDQQMTKNMLNIKICNEEELYE